MIRPFICFLFAFGIVEISSAQQYNWKDIGYTEEINGLSIYDISEDSSGYIWLATDLGMGRYNGKLIELFNKENGWPVSSKINSFIIDQNQNLWIDPQGLNPIRISKPNGRHVVFNELKELEPGTCFTSNSDTVFAISSTGIYIYKDNSIINHIPLTKEYSQTETFQSIAYNPTNHTIYVATLASGVIACDIRLNKFSIIDHKDGLINDQLTALYYQPNIGTWVGGPFGLCLIDNSHKVEVVDSFEYESKITKIVGYKNETYASTFQGIRSYKNKKKHNIYYSESEQSNPGNFYSIIITKDGTLVGGTGGNIKILRNKFIIKYGPEELSNSPVYGNTSDSKRNYYLGQLDRYFVQMKLSENKIVDADTIITPHYAFHTFIHPINGKVYVSGFEGFGEYDGKQYRSLTSQIPNEFYIYSSWFDFRDSSLYIGTGFGAVRIYNDKISLINEFINGKAEITSTIFLGVATSYGNFVATKFGVRQIFNGQIEDIEGMENLPETNTEVYSMVADKYQNVWADVNNNCILRVYKDKDSLKLKLYNIKKMYGVKGPFKLVTKGDSLWVKTFSKIYLLNIAQINNNEIKIIHTLDLSDGINGDYPHGGMYHADVQGNLWMSSGEGLQVIKYSEISKNTMENRNYLLCIKVKGEKINLDKYCRSTSDINDIPLNLSLPYYLNELSFDYIGLCHQNQEKVRYKVKLVGYDKDWRSISEETTINFSNLAPGSYRFEFISCNNDGIWNTTPYVFSFRIKPPWWGTWWFRGIIAVILGLSVYLLFMWRINQLKRKNREQEKITGEILEAQEAERKRIASDLHDSIGQELSILKLNAQKEKYENILPKISKVIDEIRSIARNIHPKEFEIGGLEAALEKMIEDLNENGTIEFVLEIDELNKYIDIKQQIIIYRIIQECVNNIVKHSNATNAKIAAEKSNGLLTISVQDNGSGFDASRIKKHSLGFTTLKERTKFLKGSIQIKSSINKGTTINILLPV